MQYALFYIDFFVNNIQKNHHLTALNGDFIIVCVTFLIILFIGLTPFLRSPSGSTLKCRTCKLSFTTWRFVQTIQKQFEYHTFLHHFQTITSDTHKFEKFEYHTFLHHSQTRICKRLYKFSLSTIHFYIILKQLTSLGNSSPCLSTIHFYIILKLLAIVNIL